MSMRNMKSSQSPWIQPDGWVRPVCSGKRFVEHASFFSLEWKNEGVINGKEPTYLLPFSAAKGDKKLSYMCAVWEIEHWPKIFQLVEFLAVGRAHFEKIFQRRRRRRHVLIVHVDIVQVRLRFKYSLCCAYSATLSCRNETTNY